VGGVDSLLGGGVILVIVAAKIVQRVKLHLRLSTLPLRPGTRAAAASKGSGVVKGVGHGLGMAVKASYGRAKRAAVTGGRITDGDGKKGGGLAAGRHITLGSSI